MAEFGAILKTLLGTLVGGRCYPLVNNSATIVSPYITWQEIYSSQYILVDNATDPEMKRVQIDVWATTYSAAKTLAKQVMTAMQGSTLVNIPLESQDLYEEVSKEFRVLLEYYIWP